MRRYVERCINFGEGARLVLKRRATTASKKGSWPRRLADKRGEEEERRSLAGVAVLVRSLEGGAGPFDLYSSFSSEDSGRRRGAKTLRAEGFRRLGSIRSPVAGVGRGAG